MLHEQAMTTRVQVLGLIERNATLPTIIDELSDLPEALVVEIYDELRCEQYDMERCVYVD